MKKLVTAIFNSDIEARSALLDLEALGFNERQISMVASDQSLGQSFGLKKGTKATEGSAVGAAAGGLIGAITAGLTATATVLIPGLNLLVFGTGIAALAGAGVGAAAGGLVGGLVGLGISEFEAKRYEDKINKGSILLAVETHDDVKVVKKIFEDHNGSDIS